MATTRQTCNHAAHAAYGWSACPVCIVPPVTIPSPLRLQRNASTCAPDGPQPLPFTLEQLQAMTRKTLGAYAAAVVTPTPDELAQLPVPTVGERYADTNDSGQWRRWSDGQNATPKPHYRLHVRLIGCGVNDMDRLQQWCIESRATKLRTAWQFHVQDAYELAQKGRCRFTMTGRTW